MASSNTGVVLSDMFEAEQEREQAGTSKDSDCLIHSWWFFSVYKHHMDILKRSKHLIFIGVRL